MLDTRYMYIKIGAGHPPLFKKKDWGVGFGGWDKKIVSFVFYSKTVLIVFKSDKIVVSMVFVWRGNMRKRELIKSFVFIQKQSYLFFTEIELKVS